jgi:hypothetical protein
MLVLEELLNWNLLGYNVLNVQLQMLLSQPSEDAMNS